MLNMLLFHSIQPAYLQQFRLQIHMKLLSFEFQELH